MTTDLKALLDHVAAFAGEAYPGYEHAVVVIHHGPGVTNTMLVAFPPEVRTETAPEAPR
jgi:hypothetical protein